jgi:hypothetical protein
MKRSIAFLSIIVPMLAPADSSNVENATSLERISILDLLEDCKVTIVNVRNSLHSKPPIYGDDDNNDDDDDSWTGHNEASLFLSLGGGCDVSETLAYLENLKNSCISAAYDLSRTSSVSSSTICFDSETHHDASQSSVPSTLLSELQALENDLTMAFHTVVIPKEEQRRRPREQAARKKTPKRHRLTKEELHIWNSFHKVCCQSHVERQRAARRQYQSQAKVLNDVMQARLQTAASVRCVSPEKILSC